MYINLGNINLQYVTQNINDWMIISEVVESGMSYDRPQLVRTVDELNIWFGKEFPSYNYLKELIMMGVTLYLYKPISTKTKLSDSKGYIDLSEYIKSEYNTYISEADIDWIEEYKNNPSSYKILVVESEGKVIISGNNIEYYCTYYGSVSNSRAKISFLPLEDSEQKVEATSLYTDLGVILSDSAEGSGISLTQLEKDILPDKKLVNVLGYDYPFIWKKDEDDKYFLENTEYLNQNTEISSDSLNNRDTLLVTTSTSDIKFVYPEYLNGEEHLGVFSNFDYSINYSSNLIEDKIELGLQGSAFRLKCSSADGQLDTGYIIIPRPIENSFDPQTSWLLFKNGVDNLPDSKYYAPYNAFVGARPAPGVEISYTDYYFDDKMIYSDISSISTLASQLQNCGYEVITVEENHEYLVYSNYIVPVLYFQSIGNLEFTPLIDETRKMLFNSLDRSEKGIEFWSKTIGRGSELDDDDLISVEIEESETEDNYYRITIARYTYSEVFEGPVLSALGDERLDFKITKNSKLVDCCILNGTNIRTGKFYLRGATKETYTQENYLEGIKPIFDIQDIPVYPDYFLIPDITNYITGTSSELTYYPTYNTFLGYAKDLGCQFLIQNDKSNIQLITVSSLGDTSSFNKSNMYTNGSGNYLIYNGTEWTVPTQEQISIVTGGGNFVYNKTDDKDNYLVYFYGDMEYNGYSRPGYYSYLRGLLLGEFSISEKDILYTPPVNNPYETESIESSLEKYKCNYLVCNNQKYYYKKYFNGKTYNTTAWMRFVIGKIYREIEKNRGKIIASKFMGKVRKTIEEILNSIQGFSIVKIINLTDFVYSPQTNSLEISIDTYVNDLVNNNVKLDITINYNTY